MASLVLLDATPLSGPDNERGTQTYVRGVIGAMRRLPVVERPDLVILDVKMPGEYDGYDVARQLKAEPATRQIPVLMLSALNMAHEREWGKSQGADAYFCKPIDPNELVAKIEALVKPRNPAEVLS